jgi:hypothetical protein
MQGQQMRALRTWSGRSQFRYAGSVARGVNIRYGSKGRAAVTAQEFAALLVAFGGRCVDVGTSRTAPPRMSLGAWLQQRVTRTAIASYVAPILLAEGLAVRVPEDRHRIQFRR